MIVKLNKEHSKIAYLEYLLGGNSKLETIVSNCLDSLWNNNYNEYNYKNYLDDLRDNVDYPLYRDIVDVIYSIMELKPLQIELTTENKEILTKIKCKDNFLLFM